MKRFDIKASLRTKLRKSENNKLRKEGLVPGVIYGGEENVFFKVSEIELNKLVFTPKVYLINLDVEGKTYFCHIQDLQFDPVTDRIIHIDLMEISEKKPITLNVPIKIVGQSEGVKAGGKLLTNMRKIKVKALADNMPDELNVDITPLNIGQTIQIKELEFENLELLDPATNVVVMVKSARGVAAGMELEEDLVDEEAAEGEEQAEGEEKAEDSTEEEGKE